MNTDLLLNLPLWIANLALAAAVLWRAPRQATTYVFCGFVLPLVVWACAVKLVYIYAAAPSGILWARLAFVAGALVGMNFVLFCECFPDSSRFPLTKTTRLFLALGLAIAGLSLTPWIVSDIAHDDSNGIKPTYGSLYSLFSIFLLCSVSVGIAILVRKWRRARGRQRLQIQYLCLGLSLFFAGATTTNVIIPLLAHTSRFSKYGPYFSLFVVGLTAHAIIRHRLMNIRLVIRASITYGLSLGVVAVVMWSVVAMIKAIFEIQDFSNSVALLMTMGVGSVILFHPLQLAVKSMLDKYCYREAFDYRRATSSVSGKLPLLMRSGPLSKYLTTFLLTTFKVEFVAIYRCEQQNALTYQAGAHANEDWTNPGGVDAQSSIDLLTRIGKPILREEAAWRRGQDDTEALVALFADLNSVLLAPLVVEQRLLALIAIGEKLSGDAFFQQDIELLTTIEHQASVAFRRAELYEEVALMQEYNENILRQMKSGVVAVNAEGFITLINEAAISLLRLPSGRFHDCHIRDILDSGLSTPLLLTLTGEVIYTEHEITVTLAEDQALPLVLGTSTLHGPDGESAGAILVFHDLSRVKEMAEEKQRIERLASVGAFAGKIAHEIKNPLVAIKTMAELLPDQYDDEEFRSTFADIALQEVERIDSLVRRLRGLKTTTDIRMAPLDILTPLQQTLHLISSELQKRHIEVTQKYASYLPPIVGSSDQLKQVFLNIALNSAEAMGQSGKLTITIEVVTEVENPDLIITFSDTGPGIDPDVLDTIFEPFVTSKSDGSGLGMAICKDIIKLHHGSISAYNRSDVSGAIFTIRLPVPQGDAIHESDVARHGLASTTHAVPTFIG